MPDSSIKIPRNAWAVGTGNYNLFKKSKLALHHVELTRVRDERKTTHTCVCIFVLT